MSEPELLDEGSVADNAVSRPVLLRQSREVAGLHIAALAAALKVPVKKLEALEAGRYDELPDMTFARALASSACRQLKIDPAPVLAQIPVAHSPKLGDSPQAINTPFKHAQDPAPLNPMGWLSRPAVLGAIALLLAALVLVFMPGMETVPPTDAVMPPAGSAPVVSEPAPAELVSPVAVDATAPTATLAAEAPAVAAAVAAAPMLAASSTALPLPTTAVEVVGSGTAAQLPGSEIGSLLSIAATGDSWVEVVNGSGAVVVQRMLKAGDVIDFSTAPPYSVVLGRVDAAQVTVRGRPFDVSPYARNSVARFEVK